MPFDVEDIEKRYTITPRDDLFDAESEKEKNKRLPPEKPLNLKPLLIAFCAILVLHIVSFIRTGSGRHTVSLLFYFDLPIILLALGGCRYLNRK